MKGELMGTTGWVVLALLVLTGTVVWRMSQYPGTWRHTFDPHFSKDRGDLRVARKKLRRLQQSVEGERTSARSAVETAAYNHESRVREAEQHLARLRDPGRGAPRGSLADRLYLYDHVLKVTTDGGINAHPLQALAIDDQYSRSAAHIYLTLPDGRRELLTISLKETPEAEARAFAVQVHNAIAEAKTAKAQRKALIPQAEAELQLAIADTSERERAEERLREVTARLNADTRIPRARRELAVAQDRWEQLTGRRPQ
ncbi:hypothetical protein [Kitasatospora sp. NPDC059327]|uniref:hypothetical protein n=1 Tax=Kitasatospora sp. NPDC059327 TaxID=3346803 RepID=UPI0036C65F6D